MTSDVTGVSVDLLPRYKDEEITAKCCKLQRREQDVDGAGEVVQGEVVELPEKWIAGDRSKTRDHGQNGEHLPDLFWIDAL